jgi:hypothetical protein
MFKGLYGPGKETLPRVVLISISRFTRSLPRKNQPLEYLVTIHEEGTGISWKENIKVELEIEKYFLETVYALYKWSLSPAVVHQKALTEVKKFGRYLYNAFITQKGDKYLKWITPTAILLDVDETSLNLPWELMLGVADAFPADIPFGRVVSTRIIPLPARNPSEEDEVVRLLAVINPTEDLKKGEMELAALSERVKSDPFLKLDVLEGPEATRANFKAKLAAESYDIIHFGGHSAFQMANPAASSLVFADGRLTTTEIMTLPWKAPPYLVFNSSCESGRAAAGKRLVSTQNQSSGLVSAFLVAGVSAYIGYFWPVTEDGAALFANTFYEVLCNVKNVGKALLEARMKALQDLSPKGDFTGYSAILYGDAATKERRDLASAS